MAAPAPGTAPARVLRVAVTDSLPAVSLTLHARACPAPALLASATLQCTSANATVVAVYPADPARGSTVTCQAAAGGSGADFEMHPAFVLQPAFARVGSLMDGPGVSDGSTTASAFRATMITCTMTTTAEGAALAQYAYYAEAVAVATRWPLLQDAVALLPGGWMRSAWAPYAQNMSGVLLDACTAFTAAPCTLADALALPAAVQAAAALTSANASAYMAAALAAGTPLSLTLAASATLVLVADGVFYLGAASETGYRAARGTFTAATTVRVGIAPCVVHWASADGELLMITTPGVAEVCPAGAAACGYHALTVTNPPPSTGAISPLTAALGYPSAGSAAAFAAAAQPMGASLSCPPFCPGWQPGCFPLAVETAVTPPGGGGGAVLGVQLLPALQIAAASSAAPSLIAATPSTGVGAYYLEPCAGALTLDVRAPTCDDALLVPGGGTGAGCPFGEGESCSPCPPGALCPGGFRMWPQPGFFATSEAAGVVQACAPPSEDRCVGWDVSADSTVCGPSYRPDSVGCHSCADGYYGELDGSCAACPAPATLAGRGLGIALGVLLAAAAVWGACKLATVVAGGSTRLRLTSALHYAFWALSVVALLAQVAKTAPQGLPPFMVGMYAALATFQLDGRLLPSVCLGAGVPQPFTGAIMLMTAPLVLLAVAALLSVLALPKGKSRAAADPFATAVADKAAVTATPSPLMAAAAKARGARAAVASAVPAAATQPPSSPCAMALTAIAGPACTTCLAFAVLLYPAVTDTALALLQCTNAVLTLAQYAQTDGADASSAVAVPGTPFVQARLLAGDSHYVCFAGSHRPAGQLAVVTLVAYVLLWPLGSAAWALRYRVSGWVAYMRSRRGSGIPGGGATTQWGAVAARAPRGSGMARSLHAPARAAATAADDDEGGRVAVARAPPAAHKHIEYGSAAGSLRRRAAIATVYRSGETYVAYADIAELGALAVVAAVWHNPTTAASAGGSTAVVILVLLLPMLVLTLLTQPFDAALRWRRWLKLAAVVIAAFLSILNGAAGSAVVAEGSAASVWQRAGSHVQGLAVLCALLLVALGAALVVGFVWEMVVVWGYQDAAKLPFPGAGIASSGLVQRTASATTPAATKPGKAATPLPEAGAAVIVSPLVTALASRAAAGCATTDGGALPGTMRAGFAPHAAPPVPPARR
jgi:hypothetical protein